MKPKRSKFSRALLGGRYEIAGNLPNMFLTILLLISSILFNLTDNIQFDMRVFFGLTTIPGKDSYELYNSEVIDFLTRNTTISREDCHICQKIPHTPFNYTYSTPRDLLLFISFIGFNPFSKVLINNLRSFGCKAKILILFDDKGYEAFEKSGYKEKIINCSVFPFRANINILRDKNNNNKPHRLSVYEAKIKTIGKFMATYSHLFENYMTFDLADMLVQADPFILINHKREVQLMHENACVACDDETRVQFSYFLKGDLVKYGNFSLITGSVTMGDPFECTRFYDLVSYYLVKDGRTPPQIVDQGIFTHLFFYDIYKYIGLPLRAYHFHQGYIAPNIELVQGNIFGKVTFYNTSIYPPVIIHHPQFRCGPCEDYLWKCAEVKSIYTTSWS
ncbi:hypothetical protein TVAG_495970 [Trichomonas vaginalis G3]|uniref:Uncharacterized protein n=1 Tax=Trichomonas vaginalis (strain ATCC PRA-98 / G3) TaxID=412133 RepID=A2DVN6_TRIV3|nr:hypothetical protein TVAGG3_0276110 [Trichomonas vaginalis G3]EAY15578.1 hypothetical protein TVAG_495970 [Trichomonas vaginalis G3]KAI5526224.1 hypothetical protein TVAGG3_0276110 [Trichomonas vaginalis G3]|eukprot:XP_001327801.1 hypothetical protein [Trichomonas vaginalis G3]